MMLQFGSSAEGLGKPWQPGEKRFNRVVFIGEWERQTHAGEREGNACWSPWHEGGNRGCRNACRATTGGGRGECRGVAVEAATHGDEHPAGVCGRAHVGVPSLYALQSAGKDLNRKELNEGFASCMADAANGDAA